MSSTSVALPSVFKIDVVDEVYDGMKTALDGTGDIEIVGKDVTNVDFAGIQLLLAFAKQCGVRERPFELKDPSETLMVAINDVGARAHLGVN